MVRSISYDVFNRVPGESTVLKILSQGARIKKGDLVCEIDSSTVRSALLKQQVATTKAEVAYQNAKLTRQVAEVAVREYQYDAMLKRTLSPRGEVAVEATDLTRAVDRAAWSRRMYEKGYVSKAQKDTDEMYLKLMRLSEAKLSIEKAETKRAVLEKITRVKKFDELQSEFEKARAEELWEESILSWEKMTLRRLEPTIADCCIHAPAGGELVLASGIHEGAVIREGQLLFRVLTEERVETPK